AVGGGPESREDGVDRLYRLGARNEDLLDEAAEVAVPEYLVVGLVPDLIGVDPAVEMSGDRGDEFLEKLRVGRWQGGVAVDDPELGARAVGPRRHAGEDDQHLEAVGDRRVHGRVEIAEVDHTALPLHDPPPGGEPDPAHPRLGDQGERRGLVFEMVDVEAEAPRGRGQRWW